MPNDVVARCESVSKTFRTWRREPGLVGVVRSFWRREWREVRALRDIQLEVREGDFVGLIGANGAGKTTLVKCLTGIVPVSVGRAELLGCDSFRLRDDQKRQLSIVMGQRSQLWWDLPAIESFRLLREIYSIPKSDFELRLERSAQRLQVEDKLSRPLRQLSLGERMKMEIIGAFLHAPRIVFLDEPTIGLDLLARETIRKHLLEVNREEGVTIVLTSHDMEDIEETCRRLVILRQGSKIFDDDLVALMQRVYERRAIVVHLEPSSKPWSDELAPRIAEFGAQLERAAALTLTFSVPAAQVQRLVPRLFELFAVRDLAIERHPLELLVRQIFQDRGAPTEGPAR